MAENKLTVEEKKKKLDTLIMSAEKKFGNRALQSLGDKSKSKFPTTSSGDIGLDLALNGGFAVGRISEIFADSEATGKTTLALHAIAEVQKVGGTCAFVDAEHGLDPAYAQNIGVDVEKLLISQPECGEDALELVDMLIESGIIDFIVVDSVSALVPKTELEGEMGDQQMGLQARMMSKAMRKLTGKISKYNSHVTFINQARQKIGQMFGNPNTTTGGMALKFFASQRVKVRKIDFLGTKENPDGIVVEAKVVKNKIGSPFKKCEYTIIYGQGISQVHSLLNLAVKQEIIEKSGSWYSYKGERIGQGKDNASNFIKERPEMYAEIDRAIRKVLFGGVEVTSIEKDADGKTVSVSTSETEKKKRRSVKKDDIIEVSDG